MKPSKFDNPNDVRWLAYQYVTGELSVDDSEMFEVRLLDDQAAREAVADAVQLHDGMLAAGVESMVVVTASSAGIWKRVASVVAMIAAVAVCIVLAQPETVAPSSDNPGVPAVAVAPDEPADQKLAELWATQWEGEQREVAVADDWTESVQPQDEISWDESFEDEGAASWMWEALDATVANSEGEQEMPEGESL